MDIDKIAYNFFKVLLFVIFVLFLLWIFGLHYEIGRGEHTGFITAVEHHGVFFKTNTVYLKTDTQSSQEDDYCVLDSTVYDALQKYSTTKQHLNVYFFSWFSPGITNCNDEGGIIYKVEPIIVQ